MLNNGIYHSLLIFPSTSTRNVLKFLNIISTEICIKQNQRRIPIESLGKDSKDKKYVKEMDCIWHDKLGEIIFNQLSQSPVTTLHNTCIFPMTMIMSKYVSQHQANIFGAKLLKVEQLREMMLQMMLQVFDDCSHLVALG